MVFKGISGSFGDLLVSSGALQKALGHSRRFLKVSGALHGVSGDISGSFGVLSVVSEAFWLFQKLNREYSEGLGSVSEGLTRFRRALGAILVNFLELSAKFQRRYMVLQGVIEAFEGSKVHYRGFQGAFPKDSDNLQQVPKALLVV